MKIEADIPDGFHVMHAESSRVKNGSLHWLVWMRKDPLGEFRGGQGFTLQEAVDAAMSELYEALALKRNYKPDLGIKLDLNALRLK